MSARVGLVWGCYRVFAGWASLGPAVDLKPPLLKLPSSGSWTWAGLPDWLRRILCDKYKALMSLQRIGWKRHTKTEWEIGLTHFPHSFFMPRWVFLFSGETGDCCPESTPEDRGDWSERTLSSGFPGLPSEQQQTNAFTSTKLRGKIGAQNNLNRDKINSHKNCVRNNALVVAKTL